MRVHEYERLSLSLATLLPDSRFPKRAADVSCEVGLRVNIDVSLINGYSLSS